MFLTCFKIVGAQKPYKVRGETKKLGAEIVFGGPCQGPNIPHVLSLYIRGLAKLVFFRYIHLLVTFEAFEIET